MVADRWNPGVPKQVSVCCWSRIAGMEPLKNTLPLKFLSYGN